MGRTICKINRKITSSGRIFNKNFRFLLGTFLLNLPQRIKLSVINNQYNFKPVAGFPDTGSVKWPPTLFCPAITILAGPPILSGIKVVKLKSTGKPFPGLNGFNIPPVSQHVTKTMSPALISLLELIYSKILMGLPLPAVIHSGKPLAY